MKTPALQIINCMPLCDNERLELTLNITQSHICVEHYYTVPRGTVPMLPLLPVCENSVFQCTLIMHPHIQSTRT